MTDLRVLFLKNLMCIVAIFKIGICILDVHALISRRQGKARQEEVDLIFGRKLGETKPTQA